MSVSQHVRKWFLSQGYDVSAGWLFNIRYHQYLLTKEQNLLSCLHLNKPHPSTLENTIHDRVRPRPHAGATPGTPRPPPQGYSHLATEIGRCLSRPPRGSGPRRDRPDL